MVWAFAPAQGSSWLAAWCGSLAEWDRVVGLGAHVFDGQRAVVCPADSDRSALLVRFLLDQPFRMAPTLLHFEDERAAERVAALGVHVWEGAPHRASLVRPGVVALDRLFADEPPEQFHGRTWSEHLVAEGVSA